MLASTNPALPHAHMHKATSTRYAILAGGTSGRGAVTSTASWAALVAAAAVAATAAAAAAAAAGTTGTTMDREGKWWNWILPG